MLHGKGSEKGFTRCSRLPTDNYHFLQVYLDDVLCGTVVYSPRQCVYAIQCGRSGTTVKITQDRSDPLTLCEVKAFRH